MPQGRRRVSSRSGYRSARDRLNRVGVALGQYLRTDGDSTARESLHDLPDCSY